MRRGGETQFSIHGTAGQAFRGALKRLIQVTGVTPSRHGRGTNREGEKIGVETIAAECREAAATHDQE